MSKEYKIKTTGYGSDVFVYPINGEQLEALRDGDVLSGEMDIDEVCEILEIDDYYSSDYAYSGINANGGLTDDITITVYDDSDNIVWESDYSFQFHDEFIDYTYEHSDGNHLLIQDILKGEFMIYTLNLEDDEEFNPELLKTNVTQICDGVVELLSELSYGDKEMIGDFGDNRGKGINFYLIEG